MSLDDMIDDVSATRSISINLRDLLTRARHVKQSENVDPPLQIIDFENEVVNIANPRLRTSSSAEPQHAALETAARKIFYECLSAFATDDASFVDICNLLDILQFCANHKQCDASLPLWLVEELLDSQTIDGCKRVFDYLESRRERMITDTFHKNKQMIVLRSCNELLRRLSRAEDAVFCGRVFMFLFQSFPLGDKSSVNLRGEFHVENTTAFDIPGTKTDAMGMEEKMDIDSEAKAAEYNATADQTSTDGTKVDTANQNTDVSKIVIDGESSKQDEPLMSTDELYSVFWSLQSVFSNPTKVFAAEEFDAFKKGLDATVQKFKSVTKVLQTHGTPRARNNSRIGIKRKRSQDDDELASNFNPKYLTSRDLFELEMSDLTFQRHILVQALILIDFLLSLTPKAKKKLAELKAQKAMIYNYTLSAEDTTWATTIRNTISAYLQDGPEGKFYYRMIDNVLSRDKNWVRWKTESCPPISLPPLPTTFYTSALNGAKRACAPRRLRATPLGSLDLRFLTEETGAGIAEKRLELLREPARYTPPGIEVYIGNIKTVDMDIDFAKEEDEKKELVVLRASKMWRVLRLAAKEQLKVLGEVDERGNLDVLNPKPKDEEGVDVETDQDASAEDKGGAAEDEPKNATPPDAAEEKQENVALSAATVPEITIEQEAPVALANGDESVTDAADAGPEQPSTTEAENGNGDEIMGNNMDATAAVDEGETRDPMDNIAAADNT